MNGLVLQGFAGTIAQIIWDGLGAGGAPPAPEPLVNPPTRGGGGNRGRTEADLAKARAENEAFDRSIRAIYDRVVKGIDPVAQEIARLEAIAREPLPEYKRPVVPKITIRMPAASVMAAALQRTAAPPSTTSQRYNAAIKFVGSQKPSRFTK